MSRNANRESNSNQKAGFSSWVFRGACYGFGLGALVGIAVAIGIFTFWQEISLPENIEDKAINLEFRILPPVPGRTSLKMAGILLETQTEKLYAYNAHSRTPWQEFNPSDYFGKNFWINEYRCNEEFRDWNFYWVYSPPEPAKVRLDCELITADHTEIHRFVLSNSGRIWLWNKENSVEQIPIPLFLFIQNALGTAIVGGLGGGLANLIFASGPSFSARKSTSRLNRASG